MTRIIRPGGLAKHPFYYYHVSRRLGVVLVSICKNACSAQKRWLLEAEGIDPMGDVHGTALARLSLLNVPQNVRDEAIQRYPIVCFLRDPFLRLVSAYCDKMISSLNLPGATAIEGVAARAGVRIERDSSVPFGRGGDRFASCSRVDYERGISFREFVEHVSASDDLDLDPHWRSQAWYLGPAIHRARQDGAPQTTLVPMQRVSEILGQIGRAQGVSPPHQGKPESDDCAPAVEDLSDVPAGELRKRARRPLAAELFNEALIELTRRRFALDISIWEQVSRQPAAGEVLRSRVRVAALAHD